MSTRRSRGVLHLSSIPSGAFIAFIATLALGSAGCRSDILKDKAIARPESALAARVNILEGSDCPGQASVVTAPEQCVWPGAASRSRMMSAVVQFVAHVGADGRADGARVLNAPPDHDFESAAVECALRTEYRPQLDESGAGVAGETCPVTLKLARYAPDVAQVDATPFPCPPVAHGMIISARQSFSAGGGTSDCAP